MNDIVKMLREVNGGWVPDIALEAANEIERLREALKRIASYPIPRPYFGKGGAITPESMRSIARAALEETSDR